MTLLVILLAILQSCNITNVDTQMEVDQDSIELNYLALGDSYTIGESVGEMERFPYQLINSDFNKPHTIGKYKIIARTGWTTRNLLDAMDDEDLKPGYYDFITLLIGVNNQYQGKPISQYELEYTELINRALALLKGDATKLIVVSIPDYGVTPFAANRNPEKIAKEIDQYNNIKEEITKNKGARYVYITDLTRLATDDLTLLANDQLHPSGKSYGQWVERIIPVANEIIDSL